MGGLIYERDILQFLEILYSTQRHHLCKSYALYGPWVLRWVVMVDFDLESGRMPLEDKVFFEPWFRWGQMLQVHIRRVPFRACDEVDEFAKEGWNCKYSCKKSR